MATRHSCFGTDANNSKPTHSRLRVHFFNWLTSRRFRTAVQLRLLEICRHYRLYWFLNYDVKYAGNDEIIRYAPNNAHRPLRQPPSSLAPSPIPGKYGCVRIGLLNCILPCRKLGEWCLTNCLVVCVKKKKNYYHFYYHADTRIKTYTVRPCDNVTTQNKLVSNVYVSQYLVVTSRVCVCVCVMRTYQDWKKINILVYRNSLFVFIISRMIVLTHTSSFQNSTVFASETTLILFLLIRGNVIQCTPRVPVYNYYDGPCDQHSMETRFWTQYYT